MLNTVIVTLVIPTALIYQFHDKTYEGWALWSVASVELQ